MLIKLPQSKTTVPSGTTSTTSLTHSPTIQKQKMPQGTHAPIWSALPLLVRDQILKELRDDYDPATASAEDKKHRAGYAGVSREWQKHFEAANFERLVLHQNDTAFFSQFLTRRTGAIAAVHRLQAESTSGMELPRHMPLIKHVWLRVELREYDCWNCAGLSRSQGRRNDVTLTRALWNLLSVLQAWEKTPHALSDAQREKGITLELSTQSPSDADHLFTWAAVSQPGYPRLGDHATQRQFIRTHRAQLHDRGDEATNENNHLFCDGTHQSLQMPGFRSLPGWAIERWRQTNLMSITQPGDCPYAEWDNPRECWPATSHLVARVLIRRECQRHFALSQLMALLQPKSAKEGGIREMRIEQWRHNDNGVVDRQWDRSFGPTTTDGPLLQPKSSKQGGTFLETMLPSSLESLHLFEDFCKVADDVNLIVFPRASNIYVLRGLAVSAPFLKHLSVSFFADAMQVLKFSSSEEEGTGAEVTFPHLESLALTSQRYLVSRDRTSYSADLIDKLLLTAAKAATKMPKLQIMEIWNSGNGEAVVFRYEAQATMATRAAILTWRSSWYQPGCFSKTDFLPFGKRVVEAWEKVADTIAGRPLRLDVRDMLPAGDYSQYAGVLGQLKLRRSILDATSEMQVRAEAEGLDVTMGSVEDVPLWQRKEPWIPPDNAG